MNASRTITAVIVAMHINQEAIEVRRLALCAKDLGIKWLGL
jgi:hypothetical protein